MACSCRSTCCQSCSSTQHAKSGRGPVGLDPEKWKVTLIMALLTRRMQQDEVQIQINNRHKRKRLLMRFWHLVLILVAYAATLYVSTGSGEGRLLGLGTMAAVVTIDLLMFLSWHAGSMTSPIVLCWSSLLSRGFLISFGTRFWFVGQCDVYPLRIGQQRCLRASSHAQSAGSAIGSECIDDGGGGRARG